MFEEARAIEAVIQLYFDGLYEGSTAKLALAFHPCVRLYFTDAGAVRELPRAEWFSLVEGRPAPAAQQLARTDKIAWVDVAHNAAVAKVECSIAPRYFTDYLTFLKTDQGWQIVSKASRIEVRENE